MAAEPEVIVYEDPGQLAVEVAKLERGLARA